MTESLRTENLRAAETVDPDEVVNLAADASHAAVLAELRNRVKEWRAATHDPWLAGITDPFGHAH